MLQGLLMAALGLGQLAAALPRVMELDYGSFRGSNGSLTGTSNYLGMPFAKAGRLENPRLIGPDDRLEGVQDASRYGLACPQQNFLAPPLYAQNQIIGSTIGFLQSLIQPVLRQGEDCLTINVQVPEGLNSTAGLPVLMWIHGGGFALGSSGSLGGETTAVPGVIYQGANLVKRSVEMDQPIVFVSANYRLNFFGTLSSREVTDAGISNLVLKDQDVAFEWVQKYIRSFGGDPDKVTVFGESSGAMSTTTHMVMNGGDVSGKFRAAWMFSGPAPMLRDFSVRGQEFFDRLMGNIGCGGATNKIQCAKDAAYNRIYAAIQGETSFLSYTATLVPWYPRPDGQYLVDDPAKLTAEGTIANIPFVIGNMIDEGTLFSLVAQLNVTTNEDIVDYFQQVYFPAAPRALIEEMVDLYSDSQADGSPYNTGLRNVIGPKYKKIASMIGDLTFVSGRRTLLNVTSARQPTWSFAIEQTLPVSGQIEILNRLRLTDIPILGSFHSSDVALNAFGTVPPFISQNSLNIMSSLIQFCNTLNPNVPSLDLPEWPQYNPQNPRQFEFREAGPRIIGDRYRKQQMDFMERNADQLRM